MLVYGGQFRVGGLLGQHLADAQCQRPPSPTIGCTGRGSQPVQQFGQGTELVACADAGTSHPSGQVLGQLSPMRHRGNHQQVQFQGPGRFVLDQLSDQFGTL